MVDLLDLAASALASTVLASATIRNMCKPRVTEDGTEDLKNARLKDDGTLVTDADFAAQNIIVQAVQKISTHVRIVGEESPGEESAPPREKAEAAAAAALEDYDSTMFRLAQEEIRLRYSHSENSTMPLADTTTHREHGRSEQVGESSTSLPLGPSPTPGLSEHVVDPSRVSVFVDPLDGTNAYTRGDYDTVSILIAIILDRRPCFGVICKPFGYKGQASVLGTGCVAFYGGTLLGGVYTAGAAGSRSLPSPATIDSRNEPSIENLPRAVISSSRSEGVVQNFVTHLGAKGMIHPEPMLISGAGEKSLRIILREENEGLWFFPKGGTSLWDVAASDALLRAMGGKLTDKFGNELDYDKSWEEAGNKDGIIACYDNKLHAECIRIFQEGTWPEE
jgi:3'-phosphoadenosine 5'-phosphosulfate (PAPS) 3'-phosphatase